VQTIDRTVQILNVVSTAPSGLTLTALCSRLDLPKTTVYRMLQALVEHDFLRKDDVAKAYRLGPALLTLGANSLFQWDLRSIARPYLEQLAQATHETVCLNVLHKDKVICLDTIESDRSTPFVVRVGREMELHCSASGKAIMAFLSEGRIRHNLGRRLRPCTERTMTDLNELLRHFEDVRGQGYALCDGELEVGVRAIAAPVMQNGRQVVGSVAIIAPAERLDEEAQQQLAPQLLQTARQVSMRLGCHPGAYNSQFAQTQA
jgi:IclR family acetate operon transcriptional repressor